MSAAATLNLGDTHLAIVTGILRAHLPPDANVWVFGSRANGRTKPYSDIDLLVDAGRRLDRETSTALEDAFDESDLPYKVDVVDRHAISAAFRDAIERKPMVQLTFA